MHIRSVRLLLPFFFLLEQSKVPFQATWTYWVALISRFPHPDTSLHCEATDTRLVYHCMVCLFTPQHSLVLIVPTVPRRNSQAEFTWVIDTKINANATRT